LNLPAGAEHDKGSAANRPEPGFLLELRFPSAVAFSEKRLEA